MNDELKQVSYKISSMNPIAKKALAKKISEEIPYDRILLLVDFVRQIHLFAWNERLKSKTKILVLQVNEDLGGLLFYLLLSQSD